MYIHINNSNNNNSTLRDAMCIAIIMSSITCFITSTTITIIIISVMITTIISMLSCVMLCYVMLCYAMLCYAMVCYDMDSHIRVRVFGCYPTSYHIILYHSMSHIM